jgi:leucyl-tRNA synthetase
VGAELEVYTTRVDTIFGATFMAIAPDHPLAAAIAQQGGTAASLAEFRDQTAREAAEYGPGEERPKRGIALGVDCINPFSSEAIPIWATNYVVSDFGTGAVMAVPAHDLRDHAFAKEYSLPIRQVIDGGAGAVLPFADKGRLLGSGEFDGMDFAVAKAAMDAWLAQRGLGGSSIQYKLRDWNMGRQRFWGAPIPMVHCKECGWLPVPDSELPVRLPARADYSDLTVSPLANDAQWKRASCPECGGPAERDTDTMTTFMDSAWYFLRFCDPYNSEQLCGAAEAKAWMPVDYYVGGKEHAVGHLLYSRFITQALSDFGYLVFSKRDHEGLLPPVNDEPFLRLFNQGIVYKDGAKMSKSKGNVVSADELADRYGADTARLFALFGGPADMDLEWSTSGVEGCHRFLRRVWRLAQQVQSAQRGEDSACRDNCLRVLRARHRAVAGVGDDMLHWRFNTAIAKLMEFLNLLEDEWKQVKSVDEGGSFSLALLSMAQLLSPFAPHLAEELWHIFGESGLVAESHWPQYEPDMLKEDSVEIAVQVNGKLRGRVNVPSDALLDDVLAQAAQEENVAKWLEGKEIVKQIYVPGRMVTFVVK